MTYRPDGSERVRDHNGHSGRMLIVGSGPAAAGAALALIDAGHRDIHVVDLGSTLEDERREIVDDMASRRPDEWTADELERISQQPVVTKDGLPQKRSFGSDYPFRDRGQLTDVAFRNGANASPVSSALGGFSNVWGAQLMPFSRATFATWPFGWDELAPHYTAVLQEVPLAGEPDDLLESFPLLSSTAQRLPPLAAGTRRVLDNYGRHRERVRAHGVTVGRARLAFRANDCVSCGLCMTGCPYGLIYSAAQTFSRLRAQKHVTYHSNTMVTRLGEDEHGPYAVTRSLTDGTRTPVRADRIFVACGGIGSTRLALGSLQERPAELRMSESIQFAVPFVSRRSFGDPRNAADFTLNQFNIIVGFDDVAYHTSQIHCYPFNPSVLTALPSPLRAHSLNAVTGQVLSRLTIGLGYLPSWASPAIRLAVGPARDDELPAMTIGEDDGERSTPLMLKQVMTKLKRVAPALDLFPVETATRLSAPAKSYHFGAGLPHRRDPVATFGTDLLGRPPEWQRIHLVDGSVLPSVPSTTFTFTVMANAHRIASTVAGLERR